MKEEGLLKDAIEFYVALFQFPALSIQSAPQYFDAQQPFTHSVHSHTAGTANGNNLDFGNYGEELAFLELHSLCIFSLYHFFSFFFYKTLSFVFYRPTYSAPTLKLELCLPELHSEGHLFIYSTFLLCTMFVIDFVSFFFSAYLRSFKSATANRQQNDTHSSKQFSVSLV